jgi:hypothetical protein
MDIDDVTLLVSVGVLAVVVAGALATGEMFISRHAPPKDYVLLSVAFALIATPVAAFGFHTLTRIQMRKAGDEAFRETQEELRRLDRWIFEMRQGTDGTDGTDGTNGTNGTKGGRNDT